MPPKKIKTVVIGAGHMGRLHAIKLAAMTDIELVSVVDSDASRAIEVAQESKCKALGSIEELPRDIEAAIISVPTLLHFKLADRLLDRGIDLLIEKPITETVEEAEAIVAKAERLKRVVTVGHIERMNPAFRAAKGLHGKPLLINARRLTPFKERARNIDVVRDLMIHDIDLVAAIVGSELKLADAWGTKIITDKVDVATAVLTAGDTRIMIEAGRIHDAETREIEIVDAKGRLVVDLYRRTVTRYDADKAGMVESKTPISPGDALELELSAFIGAIRGNAAGAVSAPEAKNALRLSLEILETIYKASLRS